MSIGTHLTERLRAMAAPGGNTHGLLHDDHGRRLVVADGGVQATLAFFDHDRYSVTLRTLEVGSGQPVGDDVRAYFSATAAEIIRRLSFLEEPLAIWELDGGARLAQLRSSPPERVGEEVSYWEVALTAGEQPAAQISRYRWVPGCVEREVVAYPATFGLVARIADGLAEALQQQPSNV